MSRVKEFTLPDLGEGLTEGEILTWLVSVGDTVTQNQPIVEVETAKAAVEIPAKWAGQVTAIFHAAGETIEVGTPIIAIDTDPGAGPLPAVEAPAEAPVGAGLTGGSAPGGRTSVLVGYGPRTTVAKRRVRVNQGPPVAPVAVAVPAAVPAPPASVVPPTAVAPAAVPAPPAFVVPPSAATSPAFTVLPAVADVAPPATGVLAKPPVRKLARDLGIDLYTLAGTGPSGTITRDDVLTAGSAAAAATPGATAAGATAAGDGAARVGTDRERRVLVKGVRKLTAEHMVASAFTAPHVTEFLTVDVTRSMRALSRLRVRPEWRDVRLSPLLLVAKAVLVAIGRHPMINASWAGDEIIIKEYINLGIAAATDRGLIVPNIADAGRLSLRELSTAMDALVATAQTGRTPPAAMTGGTFTITNVGVYGVDTGTPILPPGEAAILALGVIREAPWVHKGRIRVRQVTTLGLSFDHRIIDGELGSKFLRDVGTFLTDPGAALLAWT